MHAQLVFTCALGGQTNAEVLPLSAVDSAGTAPVAKPTQALSARAASAAARRIAPVRPWKGRWLLRPSSVAAVRCIALIAHARTVTAAWICARQAQQSLS